MENSLVIAITAGLMAMLGWGFADFFAKVTIDKIGDIPSLVWAHLIATSILIGYLLSVVVFGELGRIPTDIKELGGIAIFGVIQAFVYIFVYRAFSKGKLAILNPIFSSYSGLAVLLSIFVFGEAVSVPVLAGLVVVFMGILLISLDPNESKFTKLKLSGHPGIDSIAIATGLAALWTVMWADFASGKDWQVYASLMYVFMTITIVSYARIQKVKLKVKDTKMWKYLLFIGAGEILAYVGITYGFGLSDNVSVVALLSGAFSLPVLILSYVFLKERVDKVHMIGALGIIVGIALVSFMA